MEEFREAGVDAKVMRVLVENQQRLVGLLKRRVESPRAAKAILQQAFVDEIAKAGMIGEEESAIAWFSRMFRSAVSNHHRRHVSQEGVFARLAAESVAASVVDSSELQSVMALCVQDLASTLKPEYAEILRRVELDGVPLNEVARSEGLTAQNATARLYWAREELRSRVLQLCSACAEHGALDCSHKHSAYPPADR